MTPQVYYEVSSCKNIDTKNIKKYASQTRKKFEKELDEHRGNKRIN